MIEKYQFASDNTAGICPEAWAALAEANNGYAASYGDDATTAKACELFRDAFETDCDVYFVFNGTAANSLALASMCRSHHAVIAHEAAHLAVDECGAPQFFSGGLSLLTLAGANGKLSPTAIERAITHRSDIHAAKPAAVSMTLPTEFGTLYTPQELTAISQLAKRHGLKVHVDGARFANALAASGATAAELTWKAGVDVLCCGGTKSGMGMGEAIVFFDRAISEEFAWRCKQAGQLASKMRFIAAPWAAMLKDGAWTRHAAHANACAKRLAQKIGVVPGVKLNFPVEANAVFVDMPDAMNQRLAARGWHYHHFDGGGARFMCSWATTEEDADDLARDIASAAA